jgi:hypothetical protein
VQRCTADAPFSISKWGANMNKTIATKMAKELYFMICDDMPLKKESYSKWFCVKDGGEEAKVYIRIEAHIPEIDFKTKVFNIATIGITRPGYGFGTDFFSLVKKIFEKDLDLGAVVVSYTDPNRLGRWLVKNGFEELPRQNICGEVVPDARYCLWRA